MVSAVLATPQIISARLGASMDSSISDVRKRLQAHYAVCENNPANVSEVRDSFVIAIDIIFL